MAASFGAATATASAAAAVAASVTTENSNKSSSYLPICRRHLSYLSHSDKVTLRLSSRPELRFSSKGLQSGWNCSTMVRAQLNEMLLDPSVVFKVAVDGSLKTAASTDEAKDAKLSNEPSPAALRSEESIAEFIDQVASLVKLVDSKDIMELQLKQLDCEILIRKKEALSPPPAPLIQYVQTQPQYQPQTQPAAPASSPMPAATPPSPAPTALLKAPAAAPKSSHPPFKCPMAGTFYRSPAPGEPPFVKIGDKVKKGQVLCIIEAMKLMNEIEADQSGTLVEILAEDTKPVSVDTPLFVIQP
ncbi:biotin carboxyl carrier protein of acetyl-coa carboxylase 1 chloroplastic [Phtheirospermum japonicum]|uniref:Biotin carboxyl carrier protein of acetyl-CoA carboxylase n=2 Tax=Magnoliopsida TaxID=3398 RepID=A0A830C743_9LAMI|nr:biotin carboxyl carrier protein of acetyl-coa carboxylase 1 chloroplastic [Phtheirospermum japonicum]